jgi:hypothetical protein
MANHIIITTDKAISIAGRKILYTKEPNPLTTTKGDTTMETTHGKVKNILPSIETIKTYLTHFFTVVGVGFVAYVLIYAVTLVI